MFSIIGALLSSEISAEENLSVICRKNLTIEQRNATILPKPDTLYNKVWDLYSTVPIFLAIVMFPMLNFKSATFFTKFNSLGTFSVLYILIFVAIKSFSWGINIPDWSAEFSIKPTFCALSGMLSLSYFIHNIIISIMRNNRHQENNVNDTFVRFYRFLIYFRFLGKRFNHCIFSSYIYLSFYWSCILY